MMRMRVEPSEKIYSAQSKIQNGGKGVFAKETIHKDEVIERCPIILLQEDATHQIRQTELMDYYFMWGGPAEHHKSAICLGFGSLYNHSYTPNATYKNLIDKQIIEFVAIKDIEKEEEIYVNYNYGDQNDKSPLWIKSIPTAE